MNRNLFERPNLVLNWPKYYKNHVLPWLLQRPDKRYHDLLLTKMQFESGNFLISLLLLLLRIMAVIFMTLFPKGAQYVKSIAIVNEPFPTGAKQRDQAVLFTMTAIRMNDINLRKETSENPNISHRNLIPGVGNFRLLEGSLIITYWINYFQPFPTGAKQRDHTIIFAMASVRMNNKALLWKHSNTDISNWKESGNHVIIVQRWVGCRCLASCPSSVDYDNVSALFSEGGLKLSIGNRNCSILPLNYYYERAHAEVRRKGLRDNNIFYQEGLLYLIPDVGSSRALEGAMEACDKTCCGIWPAQHFSPRISRILCKEPWKFTGTDISSWKESGNHISIVQGCRDPIGINSCYAAYHTSLNYDNVITLVVEGSLRLSIGIWNTSPTDVSSGTQDRKSGCPLLEGNLAYRPSYILEPHFTPELAEVGLLPSFVFTRMTHPANDTISLAMDRRRQLLSKLPHLTQRMYG